MQNYGMYEDRQQTPFDVRKCDVTFLIFQIPYDFL